MNHECKVISDAFNKGNAIEMLWVKLFPVADPGFQKGEGVHIGKYV